MKARLSMLILLAAVAAGISLVPMAAGQSFAQAASSANTHAAAPAANAQVTVPAKNAHTAKSQRAMYCIHYCEYIPFAPYWCGRDHNLDYAYDVQTETRYLCLGWDRGNDYKWAYSDEYGRFLGWVY